MPTTRELFNVLVVKSTVTVRCASRDEANSLCRQFRKYRVAYNEVTGKLTSLAIEEAISVKYDAITGEATFKLAPRKSQKSWEIVT